MTPSWTGVVLAGGRSSRMGRDKALLELEGRTLLDRALDRIEPHVQELLVIGDPEKHGHVGPFVIADDVPGIGPLGGIITAMRYASNERLIVVACDMPNLTPAFFEFLKRAYPPDASALVPACDGRPEPLAAAYHRKCRTVLEACVAKGEWKVSHALEPIGATFVQLCPGEDGWPVDLFRNINTPGDL
ncbi:MAG: molybdenum cofactor guanylyltransferase [Flavobacteriales bacterium]|nr:molybdenum cofactor guanylyltransferase [Flavobacteriales bacterium]